MSAGNVVLYISPAGETVNALVAQVRARFRCKRCGEVGQLNQPTCARNGALGAHEPEEMRDPLLTLYYLDPSGEPVKCFDVAHADHPESDEPNPELPRIVRNAWMRPDERDHHLTKAPEGGDPITELQQLAPPQTEAVAQAEQAKPSEIAGTESNESEK